MSNAQSAGSASLLATIEVRTSAYLSIAQPRRIRPQLSITLSNHSYLPRVDDLQSDWVAHVAAPAFRLYRQERGGGAIESFCSIGTGSGLDVLTAIELLDARRVGLTDVHEDVVSTAADNVARNQQPGQKLVIESGYGDLLEPLRGYQAKYDLIYENLPNVPLSNPQDLALERTSSTHVPPRQEKVPDPARQQMLDLHYLALVQAREFLKPGGAVLSTIGGRVPLSELLSLGLSAGYRASFETFTWKVQADPKQVVGDHAQKQKEGFGPFYFYKAEVLEEVFSRIELASSGKKALEIEEQLIGQRLDAVQALKALESGERIGHTVAVLKSQLP